MSAAARPVATVASAVGTRGMPREMKMKMTPRRTLGVSTSSSSLLLALLLALCVQASVLLSSLPVVSSAETQTTTTAGNADHLHHHADDNSSAVAQKKRIPRCLPDRPMGYDVGRRNVTIHLEDSSLAWGSWHSILLSTRLLAIFLDDVLGFDVALSSVVKPTFFVLANDADAGDQGQSQITELFYGNWSDVCVEWWCYAFRETDDATFRDRWSKDIIQSYGSVGYVAYDHIFVNANLRNASSPFFSSGLDFWKTLNVTMLLTVSELPARTADDYDYDDEVLWTPQHCVGVRCAALLFGWFYDTWGSHLKAIINNLKLPIEIVFSNSKQKFHMIETAQRQGKLLLFSHWVPEDSVTKLECTRVTLPPFEARGFNATPSANGTASTMTSTPGVKLAKVVRTKLDLDAAAAVELFGVNEAQMEDMLEHSVRLDAIQKDAAASNETLMLANMDEIACEWMKKNEASWKLWLPRCLAGHYNKAAAAAAAASAAAANAASKTTASPSPSPSPSPPPWPPLGDEHSAHGHNFDEGGGRCVPCPPGSFREQDTRDDGCVSCPLGTAQTLPGTSFCVECSTIADNLYQDKTGQSTCRECPPLTSRHPSTPGISREECQCRGGAYAVDPSNPAACVECPEGAFCKGADAAPVPLDGFWGFKDSSRRSGRFWECSPKSLCVGGFECSPEAKGVLCSECADGHYKVGTVCTKCPGGILDYVYSVGGVFLTICLWYAINTTTARAFNAVDISLLYLQVLSTIQMYPLRWHRFLVILAVPVSIINFDLDYVTPSCLFPWNYQEHFAMVMSMMPCIGVIALGYYHSVRVLTPMRTGHAATPQTMTALRRELTARFLSFAVIMYNLLVITTLQPFMCFDTHDDIINPLHSEKQHEQHEHHHRRLLEAADDGHGHGQHGMAAAATTTTTTTTPPSAGHDRKLAAKQMLVASPSMQCWTGDHAVILIVACCGVVVYIVGIPLALWWLLRSARRKDRMHEPEALQSFGFLYKRYNPKLHYWELMLLLRRFAVSFCLVFLQHDPSFQAVLAVLCLVMSMSANVYFRPFKSKKVFMLDSLATFANVIYVVGGLMFFSEEANESTENTIALYLILLVAAIILWAFFATTLEVWDGYVTTLVYKRISADCAKLLARDIDDGGGEENKLLGVAMNGEGGGGGGGGGGGRGEESSEDGNDSFVSFASEAGDAQVVLEVPGAAAADGKEEEKKTKVGTSSSLSDSKKVTAVKVLREMMSSYCFFSARGGDDETSDSNDGERGVMSLEVMNTFSYPTAEQMCAASVEAMAHGHETIPLKELNGFLRLAGHVPVHPLGPHMDLMIRSGVAKRTGDRISITNQLVDLSRFVEEVRSGEYAAELAVRLKDIVTAGGGAGELAKTIHSDVLQEWIEKEDLSDDDLREFLALTSWIGDSLGDTSKIGVYAYNPLARLFQLIAEGLPLSLDYLLTCSSEEREAFHRMTLQLARGLIRHGSKGVASQLVDKEDVGPMLMWLSTAEPQHQQALKELFDWIIDATEADEQGKARRRARAERVYTRTDGKFELSRANAMQASKGKSSNSFGGRFGV